MFPALPSAPVAPKKSPKFPGSSRYESLSFALSTPSSYFSTKIRHKTSTQNLLHACVVCPLQRARAPATPFFTSFPAMCWLQGVAAWMCLQPPFPTFHRRATCASFSPCISVTTHLMDILLPVLQRARQQLSDGMRFIS